MDIQTCDRALQKAKIALMTKPDSVFFSDLLLSFKFKWDPNIRTACVGGSTIRINPDFFVNDLTQEEQIGVLMHEVMHPVYMHPYRLGNRDPKRFNEAGDHAINLDLFARGFSLPSWVLADKQYRGLTTEQIYDRLPPNRHPNFHQDIEYSPDSSEDSKYFEDAIVRASIRSAQEGDKPGTIPGDVQIFIDNLLTPKIKWNQLLARYKTKYTKTEYSFTKPRRRYLPLILQGMRGQTLIDIAVAADLSASVSVQEINQFVGEFAAIFKTCKPEKITLVQFDTNIKSVDDIKSFTDLMNIKFIGRGGTDIRPVIEWAKENKPQLLLVFTDGNFRFHNTEYKGDLIWVIHNNTRFKAPYGLVSHYNI